MNINEAIQHHTYDAYNYILTIDGNLEWEGNFTWKKVLKYFPSYERVKCVRINGNLSITGQLHDKDESDHMNIRVEGNLYAESIWLKQSTSILIEGDTHVKRYIYINIYTFDHTPEKILFKHVIDTPLFIICSYFSYAGRFSEKCVVIKYRFNKVNLYHPFKIHPSTALHKDLLTKEEDIKPEKLIEWFEAGKPLFIKGYTTEEDPNPIQTLFSAVIAYIQQKKWKEAQKELKKIDVSQFFGDFYMQHTLKTYYETLILTGIDKDKNAAKIEKNYIKISKDILFSGWDSKMFSREINLDVVNYLSELYEGRGEYQKALDLLKRYNEGDERYYVRKTNLLCKLGKEDEALIPALIAIEHYHTKKLDKFKVNEKYTEYKETLQKTFKVPKASRKLNLKSFIFTKIYRGVGTHDESAPVTYRSDVYWNADLIALKNYRNYFKADKDRTALVILGDFYVNGKLHLDAVDLYVEGNIFAESIHLKNSQFECTGNVIASKEIIIIDEPSEAVVQPGWVNNYSGNSVTYIFGDIRTPLLAINPEYFYLGGKISPKTVCITMDGFELKDTKKLDIHTDRDLNVNIDTDNIFNQDLYQHLINGDLFTK